MKALKSIGSAIKWMSDKFGAITTLGGLLLVPFFGAAAKREKLLNPDAGFLDLTGAFWKTLVTDPKNVLVVPDNPIAPGEVKTGAEGFAAGVGGVFEGLGYILESAWSGVSKQVDEWQGGDLTSEFSDVAGSVSAADLRALPVLSQ